MSERQSYLLSVVIPTLGRPIVLQTLRSLKAATGFEQMEVIVAGRIHREDVRKSLSELLAGAPNMRHLDIQFERGDSSEKKNAGWRAGQADLIAFLDDDVVVAPGWPAEIRKPFDDPAVGGVSGPSLVPPDVGRFAYLAGVALQSKAAGYVCERYLKGRSPEVRRVSWSRIIGCNMAYRRSVLEAVGGFDPAFWPGEEMLTAFLAGQKAALMFNPEAWVYHYPRVNFVRFWRQMHGYGATRIRLMRAGVEFEPTTIVPALWVAGLLLLLLGAPFLGLFRMLLAVYLALYLLVDLWITADKVAETRRLRDAAIFGLVPIMHASYGIAEWTELLRPGKDLGEQPVGKDAGRGARNG